jgi:hypothetical protein
MGVGLVVVGLARDREISGLYASRNEAIRAGMIMVVEAVKKRSLGEIAEKVMHAVLIYFERCKVIGLP